MTPTEFLYKKYGIAIIEHNNFPVSLRPADLLMYMDQYAKYKVSEALSESGQTTEKMKQDWIEWAKTLG